MKKRIFKQGVALMLAAVLHFRQMYSGGDFGSEDRNGEAAYRVESGGSDREGH